MFCQLPVETKADHAPETPSQGMKPPDALPAMQCSHQHLKCHPPWLTYQGLSKIWCPIPIRSDQEIGFLALCSRNFQNVKLGLTLLKFDNFTATQILCEIKFWWIQTVQKCYIYQFWRFWILILVNLSNFQVPNLLKFKVESL